MTFDSNIPNGSQSPGLFPSQNQTNMVRLKAIIEGDHVFNDSFAVNDGVHKQSTYVNRTDPASVPAGADSIVYGKVSSDVVNELWYYDSVTPRQLNWRELSGEKELTFGSYTDIVLLPPLCYGTVFLIGKTAAVENLVAQGQFVSTGTIVSGYLLSLLNPTITLGNFAAGTSSGLNLRAILSSGTTYWYYKIFYRQI